MQFSCGESFHERHLRRQCWHKWFAWRPVRVASGECRWLEYVHCKGEYYPSLMGGIWDWEYAAIKEAEGE